MYDSFGSTVAVAIIFEIPAAALFVVFQTRVVVAFVKVFEDGGEDFGFLIRKVNSFVGWFEELTAAGSLEPWRVGKNIFMCCEEALLTADRDGNDSTDGSQLSRPNHHARTNKLTFLAVVMSGSTVMMMLELAGQSSQFSLVRP